MRPTPLLLLLTLAACAPAPLADPSEAVPRAAQAAAANDARQALRLLRAGAAAGDLDAMHELAKTSERGYLIAASERHQNHFVAVWTWPGAAARARRAYDRAVRERAATGDPTALLRLADRLQERVRDGETLKAPSPARLDRARAIVDSLARAGAPAAMVRVALPLLPADRDSAAVWLARAETSGSAQACWLRYFLIDNVPARTWSAESVLSAIGRAEACRALDPKLSGRDASRELLVNLSQASRTDGPLAAPARQQLDSLRALGLIERHPRLADALGAAPRLAALPRSTP